MYSSAKIRPHRAITVTLLLAALVATSAALSAVTQGTNGALVALVLIPAVALFVGLAFGYQQLVLTEGAVRLRWVPLYAKSLPLTEIERVDIVDVSPMKYGGWGLRLFSGGVALIHQKGPGLRLATTGGREYIFTTPDPDETYEALIVAAPHLPIA